MVVLKSNQRLSHLSSPYEEMILEMTPNKGMEKRNPVWKCQRGGNSGEKPGLQDVFILNLIDSIKPGRFNMFNMKMKMLVSHL